MTSNGMPKACRGTVVPLVLLMLLVSGHAQAAATPAATPAATQTATAAATQPARAEMQQMRQELRQLRAQVALLSQAVAAANPRPKAVPSLVLPHVSSGAAMAQILPAATAGKIPLYFAKKPGAALSFAVRHGEVTVYGKLDVSADASTKGIGGLRGPGGSKPVGVTGWLPDISTNLSYAGVRGREQIAHSGLDLVYQFETQIDISAQSGLGESNSNESSVVKGGLTTRNTFLGLASSAWGTVRIGKTDAPYKLSTLALNPFLGMWGDDGVIMGNTGGDNRVEFGTRLDHSIWYETPRLHGAQLIILYAPGQNRAKNSDNIAAGESDCTGGNIPGSGGSLPYACNDGAFSDAISSSLTWQDGPLYLVAAYERHAHVNRQSDLTGEYANPPQAYFNADVADEDAAKVAAQIELATGTAAGFIFESLHRYIPKFLDFQNERQRIGTWAVLSQAITERDDLSAGWAHAGRTPGDPGQHDTSIVLPPLGQPGDGVGGADANNAANMVTVALRHDLGDGLSMYGNWGMVLNGPYAHFALGAGGRSITTDCHDASDATGGLASNPHCWAGGQIQGVSLGMQYKF